jgi:hypothetical protein
MASEISRIEALRVRLKRLIGSDQFSHDAAPAGNLTIAYLQNPERVPGTVFGATPKITGIQGSNVIPASFPYRSASGGRLPIKAAYPRSSISSLALAAVRSMILLLCAIKLEIGRCPPIGTTGASLENAGRGFPTLQAGRNILSTLR